jgi:hypothetical protein
MFQNIVDELQFRSLVFNCDICDFGRSTWPRGLRHKLSSPARTLGSWVRIPLKAWMSVCIYSVFVLLCVYATAVQRTEPPSKESYRVLIKKLKRRPRSTRAVELQIDRQTDRQTDRKTDMRFRDIGYIRCKN